MSTREPCFLRRISSLSSTRILPQLVTRWSPKGGSVLSSTPAKRARAHAHTHTLARAHSRGHTHSHAQTRAWHLRRHTRAGGGTLSSAH
eukprot:6208212-Pleurochrysis_carterae.AAC.1